MTGIIEHRPRPIAQAWLDQVREDIIEPELPIVDPHHHLWQRSTQTYLIPELVADLSSGHDIRATVFVECSYSYRDAGPEGTRPVGETAFAAGAAGSFAIGSGRHCECNAGIVGFADLTLADDVAAVLRAHIDAGAGRFRGIRHASQWEPYGIIPAVRRLPPPGLLGQADFRAGFACLAPLGLSFDAWLYHPQIPELTALARAFPQTQIVLDHLGGPLGLGPYAGRRDEVFQTWKTDLGDLAACPNVALKLGGLGMALTGFELHARSRPAASVELADLWRPYVETGIQLFGADRCMFESNFPVDKHAGSYAVLWNAFKRLAAGASADEKTRLFSGTACEIYRLTLASSVAARE